MKTLSKQVEGLKERVLAETPTHFVHTSNWGVVLTGLGLSLKIASAIFPATMPIALVALAPEIISIGVTMIVGSQTAKRDKDDKTKIRKTVITRIIDLFR